MLSSNFFSTFFTPSPKTEVAASSTGSSVMTPAAAEKNYGRNLSEMEKKYKSVVTIGSGGFGKVYSGFRRADKHPVAIKVVSGKKVLAWKTVKGVNVPLEVAMHSKVQHLPGVVGLLDHYETENGNHVLVLERPDPVQDLFDFITQRGALDEFIARVFFRQIVETVVACHAHGICHRDIKDENILVDMHTGRCYLIDFGSSDELQPDYKGYDAGTKVYCPPEWVKEGTFHSSAGTVWSLGILLYDMLCGDIPFESESQILESRLSWRRDMGAKVSERAKDLIRRCLAYKAEQRLTLEQVLAHPWLSQCKFDDNFAYYFKSYCGRRTQRSHVKNSLPIAVPSNGCLPVAVPNLEGGFYSGRGGYSGRGCSFGQMLLEGSSPSLSPTLWTFGGGAVVSSGGGGGAFHQQQRQSLGADIRNGSSLNSRASSKHSNSGSSSAGEMAAC